MTSPEIAGIGRIQGTPAKLMIPMEMTANNTIKTRKRSAAKHLHGIPLILIVDILTCHRRKTERLFPCHRIPINLFAEEKRDGERTGLSRTRMRTTSVSLVCRGGFQVRRFRGP